MLSLGSLTKRFGGFTALNAVSFDVRDAVAADRHDIEAICDRAWGETEFDSFGATFDVMSGTNVIAEVDGSLAGLVSLAVHGGEMAIVLLTVGLQL